MTTICYITNKVLNMDNNVFSLNYNKSDTIKPIMQLIFMSLENNRYKNKFTMFRETQNSFLQFSREEFINHFCKIQKTYYAFSRLAFIYKYKKSTMSVTTDIGLNDIKINDKNVLCIYHVNSRYLFNINDLLKIITTSLTNSYTLFSQPLPSKNPYNNLPFTKSNLYNIYLFLKFKTNIYNDLFIKFFHCDFNLTSFYHKYEYLLRDYILENFIKNSSQDVLIKEIKKMLSIYNKKNKKILIDDEFPKNRLIKIMKPYLLLYLQSQYSFVPIIKNNTSILLYNKLKIFRNFNQKFGRKIYKLGFKSESNFKKKSYIKSVEFLDKHIPFNYNEETNFLTNHTYYNEINTTEYIVTIEIDQNNDEIDALNEQLDSMSINDDQDEDDQDEDEDQDEEDDQEDDQDQDEAEEDDQDQDDQDQDDQDEEDMNVQHIENGIIYDDYDYQEDNDMDEDNDSIS